MFLRNFLFMEEAGNAPAPAGAPAANPGTPAAAPGITPSSVNIAPAPTGGTPASPAATPSAAPTASWMDSLPDEIRRDPSIQLFKESGVNGLAKSWVSAQATIGKDKVFIPGEKATDQEMAAFYNKLGRPESADKYEFKLPDGVKMDDELSKQFKEVAFKAGISAKQAQALVEWDASQKMQQGTQSQAVQQAAVQKALDEYAASLGGEDKFKAKVDTARAAVRVLADDKFKAFLNESGLGSRPEAIEFFSKMAGMMSEDKLRDGTGVSYGEDPATIQKEINQAESTLQARAMTVPAYERMEMVNNITKLYERLDAARQPKQ